MKKSISVLLVVLLSLGLLTGCNTNNVSSSDSQSAQKQANKEPVTLSWMVSSHPSYPYQENWYAFKKIEELTGVKLKVEPYEGDGFIEKLQIKMASGGLCDVTSGMSSSLSIQYGVEGAFADLSQSMDKPIEPDRFFIYNI